MQVHLVGKKSSLHREPFSDSPSNLTFLNQEGKARAKGLHPRPPTLLSFCLKDERFWKRWVGKCSSSWKLKVAKYTKSISLKTFKERKNDEWKKIFWFSYHFTFYFVLCGEFFGICKFLSFSSWRASVFACLFVL